MRAEGLSLIALDCRLNIATSFWFAHFFNGLVELNSECQCLTLYLMELSMMFVQYLDYKPSVIAAASIVIARSCTMKNEDLWPKSLARFGTLLFHTLNKTCFYGDFLPYSRNSANYCFFSLFEICNFATYVLDIVIFFLFLRSPTIHCWLDSLCWLVALNKYARVPW